LLYIPVIAARYFRLSAVCARAHGAAGVVAWLLGCLPLPSTAQVSDPLPITLLAAGKHIIRAEVANTEASRRQGLMYRKALPDNEGMLFVFEEPAVQCFWMRNTLLALSIAFITDDGAIINIEDMAPQTENAHCAEKPVRYALEMAQGWFDKHGIQRGKKINGLP